MTDNGRQYQSKIYREVYIQRYGRFLKTLKIATESLLAMAATRALGLRYSSSAGMITLLNIQDTKRETLRVTAGRLLASLTAMVLGPVSLALTGYRPLAMGIFLLMLTPLCVKQGVQEEISVNTVLIAHILARGSMGVADIASKALLLFVGTGIGVLLNLYIPESGAAIRSAQREIEEEFTCLLSQMTSELGEPGENRARTDGHGFQALKRALEQRERRAYEGMENSLLTDARYYLGYMGLRKNQFAILCKMQDCFSRIESKPDQASVVASLLESVNGSSHERNNALGLPDEPEQVELQMKAQPLPVHRQEFRSRTLLYLSLPELEQFLVLKKEFALGLSRKEIRRFWGQA